MRVKAEFPSVRSILSSDHTLFDAFLAVLELIHRDDLAEIVATSHHIARVGTKLIEARVVLGQHRHQAFHLSVLQPTHLPVHKESLRGQPLHIHDATADGLIARQGQAIG